MGGVFRTRTPRRRRPQAGARGSQLIAAESKKKVISQICVVAFLRDAIDQAVQRLSAARTFGLCLAVASWTSPFP